MCSGMEYTYNDPAAFTTVALYLIIAVITALLYLLYCKKVGNDTWEKYGVKHVTFEFNINIVETFNKLIKEHGDTVGFKQGSSLVLLTRDLSILREVMVKDFNNFVDRPPMLITNSCIIKSLFFLKDQDWRRIRHIITPSFSTGKLKSILPIIYITAERLATVLEDHAKGNLTVPLKHSTVQFTGAVIARSAFGFKSICLGGQDDEFIYYCRNLFKSQSKYFSYFTSLFIKYPWIQKFLVNTLHLHVFDGVRRDADECFNQMLREALIYRKEEESNGRNVPEDLLQSFIKAKQTHEALTSDSDQPDLEIPEQTDIQPNQWSSSKMAKTMTEEEIAAQSIFLIFAGVESTSTTLQMCYYLLARHPNVQEKLYEEIQIVVASETPTNEELQQLTYMEQVINETLRIFPPAPIMSREAAETKTYHGITIPRKSSVMIPIFEVLRDPKHFPEPDKFDPERFSEENKSHRDAMAFMPFGYGPRQCIGMRLAYLELKVALVHTLRKVKFELNDATFPKKGEELHVNYYFNLINTDKPIALAVQLR